VLMSIETMRRNKWFLIIVVLPVLLFAFYYALLASPEYISESHFVIKSPSQRPASITSIASILQTNSLSSSAEQSGEVIDYIRSRSALASLDQRERMDALYARPSVDFLSRYPKFWHQKNNEALYRYYTKMVSVEQDHETEVVVLRTGAFTAQDAQSINLQLLKLSEKLVNELNEHARNHEVEEAEARVAAAQLRVSKAREAMAAYRNSENLLDPSKQAAGVLDVSTKLVSEQASLRAQLQLTERAAPQNPAIPALRARIAAIGDQIAAQNGRAVGTSAGIASKLTGYERLNSEQEFAAQNLIAASVALETARADVRRQQFYLERVVEPDLPDWPELPHGWRNVLTLAGVLLCFYLVGWMFVVGILEHAPED